MAAATIKLNKVNLKGKKKSAQKKSPVRKKKKIVEAVVGKSRPDFFTNREMGWLNFNARVLAEASDRRNPLIERIKFLAISSSNLDEFFMKRVGGLKRHVAYGLTPKSSDGYPPQKQLSMIGQFIPSMLKAQMKLMSELQQELAKNNFKIVHFKDLNVKQKAELKDFFKFQVFPILTPLSVDPGHPFPFISNLSISLGVSLISPEDEEKIFARVKIPKLIDQWVLVGEHNQYIHLIEVIQNFIHELFPAMKVGGTVLFKVTRNADSDREDDDTEDLLATIEEELRQRRFAEIVRLEFGECTDPWLKTFLISELSLKEGDIYELPSFFDLTDLSLLSQKLSWAEHKFPAWSPVVPARLSAQESIFDQIRQQDILLHHPFESFSASVERFIREASEDQDVLAIKMTLYRTGDNSPFIKALIAAAAKGKQVACLIELKARFDEERNIFWAQELENAGVHVVYGVVGLKTHAKTSLVIRREHKKVKTYCHVGTGNYNVATARFYTDVGLLTSDERVTSEVIELFNYLTGKSLKTDYKHLLIAPINMFNRFQSMIRREAEHAVKGNPSGIFVKCNSLEENDLSVELYEASRAGVDIHMMVRGFCCLKPGVKGLSEKVSVQSTIGRFLEHSRIFYFRNGQKDPLDGDFFIGSADWMYRNLHARVEAVCPIYDRTAKEKLWDILNSYWNDQAQTWLMKSDGSYVKKSDQPLSLGVQSEMMKKALKSMTLTEDDLVQDED